LGVARPQPAKRVRQDGAAVQAVVAAVAPGHLVVVALEFQGSCHLLVGEPPVAERIVQVAAAVLQEDADWFFGRLADDAGIAIAAADIGVAADVAQDLAEQVGPLPGDGEGADAARAGAAYGPAGG